MQIRPIKTKADHRAALKEIETRKVVRTQFSQEEEKRLRQMFEALLRKR